MITLNLSPDCVERPIRLEVAEVEAMMIWPDDSKARDHWIIAAMMEEAATCIDELPISLQHQFAKDAWREPRLNKLRGGNRQA